MTSSNTEDTTPGTEAPQPTGESVEINALKVDHIIDRHILAAMGVGVIPIPLVDLAGVAGVQINMLRKLSEVFDTPFSKNRALNIISALAGGAVPAIGAYPLFSLVRAIPVVGWTLGAGAASLLSGASTYAVGHLIARHLAKGGSLENFDIKDAKEKFSEAVECGKEKINSLRAKKGSAADAGAPQTSPAH